MMHQIISYTQVKANQLTSEVAKNNNLSLCSENRVQLIDPREINSK